MKNVKIVSTAILSLSISLFIGCGEDRSQNPTDQLTPSGEIKKPWIYETAQGLTMVENGFIYIPGEFDVDGDGIDENGFWLSKYEAKITNKDANLTKISDIRSFIVKNFKAYNSANKKFDQNLTATDYLATSATKIATLESKIAVFEQFGKVYNNVSPLEALISLNDSQIDGGYAITLPSEKQWMQIVKLIINNPKNWVDQKIGESRLINTTGIKDFIIANNILGVDKNIPIDYERNVTNLANGVSEWTLGAINISDKFIGGDFLGKAEFNELESAPTWWKPILKNQTIPLTSAFGVGKYHNGSSLNGTIDVLEVTPYGTGEIDPYAIVARGGSDSKDDKDLAGISAAKLTYGLGYKDITVGFRAASDYIKNY